VKKLVLLVVVLATVLGGNGLAAAQTTENPPPSDATSQNSTAAEDNTFTLPCGASLFREEQQELVQSGYPTPVSQRARDCENLGYVNPYPAPAMLGPDRFVYPYDPIEGQYLYFDPNTGIYYVLDSATGNVFAYNPATGGYL